MTTAGLYPVDHGIPLPPRPRLTGGRVRQRYPFRVMEVSDSFLVPYGGEPPELVRVRVSVSCTKATRDTGYRFELRSTETGLRVWRVK